MILNQGQNEYHHLKVKEIQDYSNREKPVVILRCEGKHLLRDSTSKFGFSTVPYRTKVFVKGQLMNYVLYEIDEEDLIFVVGHTDMCKPNKYNFERMVKADFIYKEDWVKYYNNYGNINPKDLEDML